MSEAMARTIASEVGGTPRGVLAVVKLLDEGATVPFIARYRKEQSGALDEVQIRNVAERIEYLRDLDTRRKFVLETIAAQDKLTNELRARIERATTKAELEDLYLPFKKKKKSKATAALEKGLGPLADVILAQDQRGPEFARTFVDDGKGVANVEEALAGAVDIVVERVTEHADVRTYLRESIAEHGALRSTAIKSKTKGRTKFEDYYDFCEPLARVPSHRYLAVNRGETEGVLRVKVELDDERSLARLARIVGVRRGAPFAALLTQAIELAYKKRLLPSLGKEARAAALRRADEAAIVVFAENLSHLLLSAPFGAKPIVAVDPGIRTGCKCVALDGAGAVLENLTIYPLRSEKERPKAAEAIVGLVKRHGAVAIAIGNGTGGRETEQLAKMAMKVASLEVPIVSVNEAGASVYSASDVAREELGQYDLTVRGAVSIGRRLQDPLAELVKIDPKSIGVGQYQHDVDQSALTKKLREVVESCVNRVGVELSTASPALLSYVAGIGPKLAAAIVAERSARGIPQRRALLKVKGLGAKAYEQCAGFVRVQDSQNPLDRSAVHPERYALVTQMAKDLGVALDALVGSDVAKTIDVSRYEGHGVGAFTLRDIVAELEKPGRDPRSSFEAVKFRDDVNAIEDLQDGMVLNGVVTNVTAFGAFVDVGVHQDGLVHISELADRFVRDPAEVVKVGDRVKVVVLSVDLDRGRIAFSRKRVPG